MDIRVAKDLGISRIGCPKEYLYEVVLGALLHKCTGVSVTVSVPSLRD